MGRCGLGVGGGARVFFMSVILDTCIQECSDIY